MEKDKLREDRKRINDAIIAKLKSGKGGGLSSAPNKKSKKKSVSPYNRFIISKCEVYDNLVVLPSSPLHSSHTKREVEL